MLPLAPPPFLPSPLIAVRFRKQSRAQFFVSISREPADPSDFIAVAAPSMDALVSQKTRCERATLLFVIIWSVKIPPLTPLLIPLLPLSLSPCPSAALLCAATMWFTAKCHTRFSRGRKRPFLPTALLHYTTLRYPPRSYFPSPQKTESENCSHLNASKLLFTDQVIAAPPPPPPPIVERNLIFATDLPKQFCHLLPPPPPHRPTLLEGFSSSPFIAPFLLFSTVVMHVVHSADEKPISISHKFAPNSISVRV